MQKMLNWLCGWNASRRRASRRVFKRVNPGMREQLVKMRSMHQEIISVSVGRWCGGGWLWRQFFLGSRKKRSIAIAGMRATNSNASFKIKTPGQNGRFHLIKGDIIGLHLCQEKKLPKKRVFLQFLRSDLQTRFLGLGRGAAGRAGLPLPVADLKWNSPE